MDLYLWPGRWNLASFDPESLCILTYVKFGGLPVNLRTHFNPLQAPRGTVPFLQHGRNVTYGLRQIFEYLRKENYGIEYEFDEAELVRLNALMKTVEVELMPAVIHLWFVNHEIFTHVTRQAYCEAVGLPYSIFLGRWLYARAYRRVYRGHIWPSPTVPLNMIDEMILSQAKICLTSLAYILGDQAYFLGDRPSAIDAVVFGLIFPLVRAPVPHHPLKEHINQCENITRFCLRIEKRFFAGAGGIDSVRGKNESNVNNASTSADGMESVFSLKGLRNLSLFGLGAVVVNFLYAYASNMVEVDMQDEGEGETAEEG